MFLTHTVQMKHNEGMSSDELRAQFLTHTVQMKLKTRYKQEKLARVLNPHGSDETHLF